VTDPLGKWKKYTTDAMGNLVKVEEPDPASGANLTTGYTYDAMNHLTQVSMPRGSTTTRTWDYDTNQRLSSATTPESGTVNYVYNTDGTLQYKTDAKGQKTQYTYDLFGRRSQIDYFPAGSSVPDLCQTVKLYYDFALTSFGTSFGLGRLTAATWSDDASCTYHFMEQYQYAQQGFLTVKALGMATGSTAYGNAYASSNYDLDGRPTSYCMSKDSTGLSNLDCYVYQRDSLGRATGLTQGSSTPIVSGATYGAAGPDAIDAARLFGVWDRRLYRDAAVQREFANDAFDRDADRRLRAGHRPGIQVRGGCDEWPYQRNDRPHQRRGRNIPIRRVEPVDQRADGHDDVGLEFPIRWIRQPDVANADSWFDSAPVGGDGGRHDEPADGLGMVV
jgi:YD repeat-containing protein